MVAHHIRNVELVDFDAPERATADHVDREAAAVRSSAYPLIVPWCDRGWRGTGPCRR
jgi:hypothetical protein